MGDHLLGSSSYTMRVFAAWNSIGMLKPQYQTRAKHWRKISKYNVSSGLDRLLAFETMSFCYFSSVSSTMPRIVSDSEELDPDCTRIAIGTPSISRVPVPWFYLSNSSSMVKGMSGDYLKLRNISTRYCLDGRPSDGLCLLYDVWIYCMLWPQYESRA